ncbi:hypothetical protein STCU_12027 [Strigomonas culicis]|uniref:Uncharacterized protein n=1 Tax=Strigomonas culicis TaxID=28005 RepID=S9TBN6_9TRYP|nr:hypothetical protein STCU_12027 [Strigomonas culicis]|eukprot:EPY15437.1 hypothetical protein STCU_12027 [Strigomonas culicis]
MAGGWHSEGAAAPPPVPQGSYPLYAPPAYPMAAPGAALPLSLPQRGIKRPRSSKKAMKLHFLECLRRQQEQQPGRADSTHGGAAAPQDTAEGRDRGKRFVPRQVVASLFAALGGSATVGDTLEAVIGQLQQEGCLLQREGGWHVVAL